MFKICPSCGDEFKLTASRCPDCGVELQFPSSATGGETPFTDELKLVTTDGPWALEQLAELLGAQGIPSVIDSFPPGQAISAPRSYRRGGDPGRATRLGIYVRLEHLTAARALAEQLLRSRMPAPPGVDPPEDGPLDVCPACGGDLSAAAESCLACGLEFTVVEVTCLVCGQVTGSDQAACPNCGQSLDAGDA